MGALVLAGGGLALSLLALGLVVAAPPGARGAWFLADRLLVLAVLLGAAAVWMEVAP